jgi:hypothetical protein
MIGYLSLAMVIGYWLCISAIGYGCWLLIFTLKSVAMVITHFGYCPFSMAMLITHWFIGHCPLTIGVGYWYSH